MKDRKIELGTIKDNARLEEKAPQSEVNIFLPSIFLSFECFCGMLLLSQQKQMARQINRVFGLTWSR
jgi:hypothetical protein